MKKTIATLMILLFGFVCIAASVNAQDAGDKRKGKYAYRNVYKKCNKLDPSVSKKPPINPDSKTMAQWQRVFDKKDFGQFGCKQVWDTLDQDDLNNIRAYLKSGAIDSPTPAKCK